jgi:hypothetical protein
MTKRVRKNAWFRQPDRHTQEPTVTAPDRVLQVHALGVVQLSLEDMFRILPASGKPTVPEEVTWDPRWRSADTSAWGTSCVALFANLLLSFWKEETGGVLILLSTSAFAILVVNRQLFDPSGSDFSWLLPWLVATLPLAAVVGILCLASPKRPKKTP